MNTKRLAENGFALWHVINIKQFSALKFERKKKEAFSCGT